MDRRLKDILEYAGVYAIDIVHSFEEHHNMIFDLGMKPGRPAHDVDDNGPILAAVYTQIVKLALQGNKEIIKDLNWYAKEREKADQKVSV